MEALTQFLSHYLIYIIMGLSVATALGIVFSKNAVHSVISMLFTMVLIAGVYLLFDAEFLAAVQLLVYAGGIIVLFLFVVLLVALHKLENLRLYNTYSLFSIILVILLIVILGATFLTMPFGEAPKVVSNIVAGGSTEAVAMSLYTKFILPFEIASVLLLVALIGAIILTKSGAEQ